MLVLYSKKETLPLARIRFARGVERVRGLLFRVKWPVEQVLVFEKCAQVHTWFMVFSIGVIFLNDEMKVIEHVKLPPFSLSPKVTQARYTIEYDLRNPQCSQVFKGDYLYWAGEK